MDNSKFLLLALALATSMGVQAAEQDEADNTAQNDRDRSRETLTPIDQSNVPADLKITADTRRKVVADEHLSANAKNCKIITTAGGEVTLRGPVASAEEKKKIAAYAKEAGATKVTNELEIKKSE